MKIKMLTFVSLLVVLVVSILILGCEEQDLASKRRIRLVGDENLKLKEQVKSCNQQIAKLEETIAEYEQKEQKWADAEKDMGNSVIKLLKDSDAAAKEIEKLTDENLRLKVRLAELESVVVERDNP